MKRHAGAANLRFAIARNEGIWYNTGQDNEK